MVTKKRKYRSRKIDVKKRIVKDPRSILLNPNHHFQVWHTFLLKEPKELIVVASPAHTASGRFSYVYKVNEKSFKGKMMESGLQSHQEGEKWVKENIKDFKKRLVQHKSI